MEPKTVLIQFDGVEAGSVKIPSAEITTLEANTEKVKSLIKGVYDAADEINKISNAKAELQAKHDDLEGKHKELQEKFDAMEKGNPEELQKAVQTRLSLEKTAVVFKLDDHEKLGNLELMKAIVEKHHGDKVKLDDSTEEGRTYIKARYDILAEEANDAGTGLEQLANLQTLTTPKTDNIDLFKKGGGDKGDEGLSPREKFIAKSRDAFKTPQVQQQPA